MPLYSLTERDLRDHCKRAIEALETWMRRLIHQKLSDAYGANYIDATRPSGQRVVNNEIVRRLRARMSSDPDRYPTPIDATLLEDAIALLCNPDLCQHFQESLMEAFPDGHAEAGTFLRRLIPIRNALYHSNPISVHEAYRVLCYSHDVIQSIKTYYETVNMQQQFNVPQVLRVIDSLGHALSFSPANRNPEGFGMLDYSRDERAILHCGDTLSIEAEVDPTFDPSTYQVEWLISNIGGPRTQGPKFVLPLEERYVSTRLCLVCRVTSNAAWHKLGTHDEPG